MQKSRAEIRKKNTLDFEEICMRFAYGFLKTDNNINNIR